MLRILALATVLSASLVAVQAGELRKALLYKSPQCSCCEGYADYLRQNGFDVEVNVAGGGVAAQAEAVRHGISRALIRLDSDLKPALKKAGFLTRDSRKKERKKPGQPGARKKFQYSKR